MVRLAISQKQEGEAFHFPLRIELVIPDSTAAVSVEKLITEKELVLYVPVASPPRLVRVDPGLTLLAEITEDKSRHWWAAQLEEGPTVAERIRAAEHFAKSHADDDRHLLARTLQSDPFYGVRIEIAKALGKSGGDVSRDALIAGLGQAHPKVRKACAVGLGEFPEDETAVAALRAKIERGDESYFVEAESLEALAKIQKPADVELLIASLEKDSHGDAIRRAALAGLGHASDVRALDVLLEWTATDKHRDCRMAALSAVATYLARNDLPDARRKQAVEMITAHLSDDGPRVRRAAVEALRDASVRDAETIERLEALADHDGDGRVRNAARAAADRLKQGDAAPDELKRLQKETDDLRNRNRELEERLLKLEAKS